MNAMSTKPAPKPAQKNLVPMVLVALWVVALIALFMFFNKPKELDERLTKLEARSGTVSGKINPVGGDQIADIAKKIASFEKRFEELDKKISAEAAEQNKKFDAMSGRLDNFESKCAGVGKPCADAKSPKVEGEKKADIAAKPKATRKKVARKKKRDPVFSYGAPPSYPSGSYQPAQPLPQEEIRRESPQQNREERNHAMRVNHGDSLYDISSRTIPASGLPPGYIDPVKKLAPGAAIYPVRENARRY